MAKDIVKEALEQVENLKEASMQNAKNVLVNAMSTDLKAAVSQALHENLNEDSDQPSDYHVDKKDSNLGSDRVGDEISADGDTPNDDPATKGDGPAIVETGVYETDDEIEELPFDDDGEDDDEDEFEEMDMFEDDDEDYDDDSDDDDEDDVIEVVEDEGMDFEDDDEDEEEEAPQSESTINSLRAENKKLATANKRMVGALGKVKNQMDEINLFNARLAAASDLMRRVSLTKNQKERVVENMDRCRSIGEVKRAHRMIYEGLKSQKVIKKNRVSRPNIQSVVSEEASTITNKFARLNELAGL
jgi:hypothetical protein